ncbi:MAG: hypothetical protein VKM01_07985 [Cyanobacteriota bacterium]|nr:hypothetical protein [Cyanobacteriota bacterium]
MRSAEPWRPERLLPLRWRPPLAAGASLKLGLRNLYIVPTGFGAMWLGTALLLLVVAVQTQANGPLLLGLLLLALELLALPLTHQNLEGLELSCAPPPAGPSGEPLAYPLRLRLQRPCRGLRLALAGGPVLGPLQLAAGDHVVLPRWRPPARGEHRPAWLWLETRAPLGLFVCWSRWRPAASQLVWPRRRPGPVAQLPPLGASAGAQPARRCPGSDDWLDLRPHRPEEGPARLAWPLVARGRGRLSKVFASTTAAEGPPLLAPLPGLPLDAALEHLAERIAHLEARGLPYGLALADGSLLGPGLGLAHRQMALAALARWP